MKKLGLLFKEISGNQIKNKLKESGSVFIVKYSGLSSPDLTNLRQSLRGINANFFVVRNNVAKRAIKDSEWNTLTKYVEGSCGFIFIKDDPVNTSRLLCNFAKEHNDLKLECGLMLNEFLERKDIEALSKLPSQEVLRTQVVIGLKSPITGLVMVLHNALRKFVYCLEQIRQKKTG